MHLTWTVSCCVIRQPVSPNIVWSLYEKMSLVLLICESQLNILVSMLLDCGHYKFYCYLFFYNLSLIVSRHRSECSAMIKRLLFTMRSYLTFCITVISKMPLLSVSKTRKGLLLNLVHQKVSTRVTIFWVRQTPAK